jgi:23S rRNA (uridine2552-2'-O)-methyltransferase
VARYQRKDHYHQRAKREGFRSRAAYKLEEIQRAQHLLRPGQRVADLGCWPGGWLQVAAEAVGREGRVVGVDLAAIDPPLDNENVVAIRGDISEAAVLEEIFAALGGLADVFLSDAAPKLTGVRAVDRAKEEGLLESIEARIPELLRPGGSLLLKILECPEAGAIDRRIRSHFAKAKTVKAAASRKGTTERYLLATGYGAGRASG